MPFKFVDDGYPDADDYSSNYEWVEPADAGSDLPGRQDEVLPTASTEPIEKWLEKIFHRRITGRMPMSRSKN